MVVKCKVGALNYEQGGPAMGAHVPSLGPSKNVDIFCNFLEFKFAKFLLGNYKVGLHEAYKIKKEWK